ncbi:TRAP transporter small permease [Mailhella sp.]|uniref:TRAP transporter small permease n=1 Tax=Mailhella sp. TaxID=1981029 RepID=UPI004063CB5F
MGELLKKVNMFAAAACGYILAVLMVMLLLDIISRTAGHPIIGVAELSTFVMLTTVYLGMGDCERRFGHVKVEFLTDRLPPKWRKAFLVFSGILSSSMLVVCTYAMFINTIDSYVGDEAVAGLVAYPIWPVKSIMCVGILLYCLQALYNLWMLIVSKPDHR